MDWSINEDWWSTTIKRQWSVKKGNSILIVTTSIPLFVLCGRFNLSFLFLGTWCHSPSTCHPQSKKIFPSWDLRFILIKIYSHHANLDSRRLTICTNSHTFWTILVRRSSQYENFMFLKVQVYNYPISTTSDEGKKIPSIMHCIMLHHLYLL